MRLPWRRKLRAEVTPELMLMVAEVFPHEEGQALWWESWQRRSPAMRLELVMDLQRRTERG